MRLATTLAALSLVLAATACGGRPTGDGDVNALAQHLTGKDSAVGLQLSPKQARCVAKLYLKSDLSDAALATLKKGEPLRPRTQDDVEAMNDLSGEIAKKCL